MRKLLVCALLSLAACKAAPAPVIQSAVAHAPDFTLTDTDNQPVALHALLARGPVMLVFFPKAFTPG